MKFFLLINLKKVREKSREYHIHKPQHFPDTKRKRKPTNPNKHESNKRTKSTKISSLFPKRGNRNVKRTEKHKNKMAQGNHLIANSFLLNKAKQDNFFVNRYENANYCLRFHIY